MKKRLKKYIARVLWLVFTLPLTFQSYHIMHHHAEKGADGHDESHCSSSKANACKEGFSFNQTIEDCAICDYEFTTYDLPEIKPAFTFLLNIQVITKRIIPALNFGFNGNNIVLRGPPFIS